MRGQLLVCCASALVALAALGTRGFGQDDPLDQPSRQAAKFLESLSEKTVDDAYNALLDGSPLGKDQQPDRLKKVIEGTKKLFGSAVYGSPRTKEPFERVKAQKVGEDLAVLRYLYKFDQLPVAWHFTFYRTNGKWVVVGVRFDHEYESLAP